jgi:hypothetical protein
LPSRTGRDCVGDGHLREHAIRVHDGVDDPLQRRIGERPLSLEIHSVSTASWCFSNTLVAAP